MREIYETLAHLALDGYPDIVVSTALIGGTPASPNKLRILLIDQSFLDVWLSLDGDYTYHWEHRRQRGQLHRWDNAPHYPHLSTFPAHFHKGDDGTIVASDLSAAPIVALGQVLAFVRQQLRQT